MSRYVLARRFGKVQGVGSESITSIEGVTTGMFLLGLFVGAVATHYTVKWGVLPKIKEQISDLNKKYQPQRVKAS